MCSQGCGLEKGAEAHCLLRIDGGYVWDGKFVAGPAVVAVGNGTRGSVYAAFALSEHMLGVSPFHKFTFDQPVWTGKSLPLSNIVQAWGPPQFTHRTIFLNDEELLVRLFNSLTSNSPLTFCIFDDKMVTMHDDKMVTKMMTK